MGAGDSRLAPLLRWLGLTMVVILLLQLAAVLVGVDWSDDTTRPQVTGPLVALAPLGFLGLLVALMGARLDNPRRRQTPLRWLICGSFSPAGCGDVGCDSVFTGWSRR
jgi:hypothetical protein